MSKSSMVETLVRVLWLIIFWWFYATRSVDVHVMFISGNHQPRCQTTVHPADNSTNCSCTLTVKYILQIVFWWNMLFSNSAVLSVPDLFDHVLSLALTSGWVFFFHSLTFILYWTKRVKDNEYLGGHLFVITTEDTISLKNTLRIFMIPKFCSVYFRWVLVDGFNLFIHLCLLLTINNVYMDMKCIVCTYVHSFYLVHSWAIYDMNNYLKGVETVQNVSMKVDRNMMSD